MPSPRRRRRRPAPEAPAQLGLFERGRRGGPRRGAGRPRGRSGLYIPHVRRPRLNRHQAAHVTLKLVVGLPSLRRPRPYALIVAILGAESRKGFRLVHYSVRPDHLHLFCEAESALALARGIQRIAARLARALNKLFGRRGRLFADRYHGRVLRSPREVRWALRYVLLNAHKDAAKVGERMRGYDPYSSGKWFDGWSDVPALRDPPYCTADCPVVAPGAWLVKTGWKARGLIATTELSFPEG